MGPEPISILVVDDEPAIRALVAKIVERAGYRADVARDGAEAVEIAQRGQFDLILMDVRMPRMTGYEACRRLRELDVTKDIPIIFLSAKGQEAEVQQGLQAGADQYILKPFAPDMLSRKIKEVLNNKS